MKFVACACMFSLLNGAFASSIIISFYLFLFPFLLFCSCSSCFSINLKFYLPFLWNQFSRNACYWEQSKHDLTENERSRFNKICAKNKKWKEEMKSAATGDRPDCRSWRKTNLIVLEETKLDWKEKSQELLDQKARPSPHFATLIGGMWANQRLSNLEWSLIPLTTSGNFHF